MTTPALKALRGNPARRRITLLTSPAGASVSSLVPEVDEVITYDAPWMKATAPRADPSPDVAIVRELSRREFDAAVIFTVYSQSAFPAALLCHLAGIPVRLAHAREKPYGLLTDWLPEIEPQRIVRHEVQRQLDLVSSVGCTVADTRLSVRVPATAGAAVREKLRAEGFEPQGPWAVVHPGATAPSRRYPPESFRAASHRLADLGWGLAFTGGAAEMEVVESARAGVPSVSFAGRLGLGELAALLEMAPVLIANNSGPVHLAGAVGTPVVDLYALTNPQHTPWGVPHRVLSHDVPCRWCYASVCPMGHHDCLERVLPDDVVAAARALVEAPTAASVIEGGPHPVARAGDL
jgi:ADP-heptose:LPS heptosyltransferase